MKKTEHALYRDIIDGAAAEDWLLFRIQDTDRARNPFDLGGAAPDGRAAGVEVKVLDVLRTTVTDLDQLDLRAQQRNWLVAYAAKGAHALVLCHRPATDDLLVARVYAHRTRTGDVGRWEVRSTSLGTTRVLTRVDGLFRGWRDIKG